MFAKLFALTIVATTAIVANGAALVERSQPAILQLAYDDGLCQASRSLNTVSCSTGENGLITKGYTTFSSLPGYPALAGLPGVGFNSPNCGKCYEMWFSGTGRASQVTAVTSSGVDDQAILCTTEFLALTGFTRDNVPANVTIELRPLPVERCGFPEEV